MARAPLNRIAVPEQLRAASRSGANCPGGKRLGLGKDVNAVNVHLSSTVRKMLSGSPVMPMWRTKPFSRSATSAGMVSLTICESMQEC